MYTKLKTTETEVKQIKTKCRRSPGTRQQNATENGKTDNN